MCVLLRCDKTFDQDVARTVDVAVDKQLLHKAQRKVPSARDTVSLIVPQPAHVLLVSSSAILERRVSVA